MSLRDIALRESSLFAEQFRALVQCADMDEEVLVPLRALAPKVWTPQRVTLTGDAIHVMPPFGAHGANTALRDAQTLGGYILRDGARAEDLVQRVSAYEAEMRAYSRTAVREASRMMKMATADFPFKKTVFRRIEGSVCVFAQALALASAENTKCVFRATKVEGWIFIAHRTFLRSRQCPEVIQTRLRCRLRMLKRVSEA